MHVLFDADGTFLSTNYLNAEELGVDNTILQTFFTEAFPPTVLNKADLIEVLGPYLPKMGWEGSVHDFLETWFSSQNTIRDGMEDLLKEIQAGGHICGLCTQQEKYRSQYMKKEMGFEILFDGCYFTSEIGFIKKDPRFFESIIERSGIAAHDTIFIDDKSSYCDAAKNLGVQTYHFDGDVSSLRGWIEELGII